MALKEIPVLPADYPLFDWSIHQESRNALVSGGQTAEFSKETWNAISKALDDALTAGGLAWNPKYTTLDGAKITEEYGDLRAAAFNSIRYNIDHPMPIGWKWARDPEFRGYVGREDFRGHDEYGDDCDDVYPEYILELVRKMNLLIGVMRGSHVYSMAYQRQIFSAYFGTLHNLRSAVLESARMSGTEVSAPLLARLSAPLAWAGMSASDQRSSHIALPSAAMRVVLTSETAITADVKTPESIGVESLLESGSRYFSHMFARKIAYNNSLLRSETKYNSGMNKPGSSALLSEPFRIGTAEQAQVNSVRLQLVSGSVVSASHSGGEMLAGRPKMIQGASTANSSSASAILKKEPLVMVTRSRSRTVCDANLDRRVVESVGAIATSKINSFASLSFEIVVPEQSWYDPVQTGSNLYIRSVDSAWQDESKLHIDMAFFLEPIQEGNNLYIRQDIFGGE